MGITLTNCLILAAALFCIGLYGALARRNAIIVLLSIEIMLNAANVVFLAFARHYEAAALYVGVSQPIGGTGNAAALFVLALAAVEAAVGLAILIAYYRNKETVDTAEMTELKEM